MIVKIGKRLLSIQSGETKYKTIGFDTNFEPVTCFKKEDRSLAIQELKTYYNRFDELMKLGLDMSEDELNKFKKQLDKKAEIKAMEKIHYVEEGNGYCFNYI
jgi:hypothetical protein